jgi:hypothetical protein
VIPSYVECTAGMRNVIKSHISSIMILKHNLPLPSAVTIVTHSSIQSHELVLLHKMKEEDENNKNKWKKKRKIGYG